VSRSRDSNNGRLSELIVFFPRKSKHNRHDGVIGTNGHAPDALTLPQTAEEVDSLSLASRTISPASRRAAASASRLPMALPLGLRSLPEPHSTNSHTDLSRQQETGRLRNA